MRRILFGAYGMQLLYELQKDGKTHYLFGTIHLATPEIQRVIPFYTQEFLKADIAVFETDFGLAEATSGIRFTELNQESQKLFIDYLQDFKTAEQLQSMTVDEVIRACQFSRLTDRDQYDLSIKSTYQSTPDMRLFLAAKSQGKIIAYLESFSEHQETITKFLQENAAEQPTRSVESELSPEIVRAFLNNLQYQSYYAVQIDADGIVPTGVSGQSLNLIDAYSHQAIPEFEQQDSTTKILLTDRNENWLPKMVDLMARNTSVFFALGGAHFGGEEGLIKRLETQGYQITAIENYPNQLAAYNKPVIQTYMHNTLEFYRKQQISECRYLSSNRPYLMELIKPKDVPIKRVPIRESYEGTNPRSAMRYARVSICYQKYNNFLKENKIEESLRQLLQLVNANTYEKSQTSILFMNDVLDKINNLILTTILTQCFFYFVYRPTEEDYYNFLRPNVEKSELTFFTVWESNEAKKYVELDDRSALPILTDLDLNFFGTRLNLNMLSPNLKHTLSLFSRLDWGSEQFLEITHEFPFQINGSLNGFVNLEEIVIDKPGIDRKLSELASMSNVKKIEVCEYEPPKPAPGYLQTLSNFLYRFIGVGNTSQNTETPPESHHIPKK